MGKEDRFAAPHQVLEDVFAAYTHHCCSHLRTHAVDSFFQGLLSGKERMRDNVILIVLVCFTFSRILVFLVIGLKIKLYSFIFFAVAPFLAWSHLSLKLLLFGLNFFRLLWSFKSTQGADSRRKHR